MKMLRIKIRINNNNIQKYNKNFNLKIKFDSPVISIFILSKIVSNTFYLLILSIIVNEFTTDALISSIHFNKKMLSNLYIVSQIYLVQTSWEIPNALGHFTSFITVI